MRLRSIIRHFTDENRDVRDRLFYLFTMIALVALFAAFVMGLFLEESMEDVLILGQALVLFTVFFIVALVTDKTRLLSEISAFVITFIVMPVSFFTGGGVNSGAPLWFVFCVFYISLILRGRLRTFFYVSDMVVLIICYLTAYFRPELVVTHEGSLAYMDSFISFILISIILVSLISFQILIFRESNRRTEEQSRKIEELTERQNQFFSSMSHEIRTPINTILGLNEIMLKENISEEVADDAVNMQAAGKTLLSLINDILDMSKLESGNMDVTPVEYNTGDILSDIVSVIWGQAREKELEFHIEVDPMLPAKLCGDEIKIRQVLLDILSNAVKYTNKGSVTLSIKSEDTDGDNVNVIYSVSDTGIGIKRENLPYIFSIFKKIESEEGFAAQGAGLGLSIAWRFVELMGGTIKVNSVYTQGSTFIVEIPQKRISEDVVGDLDMERRHLLNTQTHHKRSFKAPEAKVLAVDDTAANLMVLKKLLRDTEVMIDTVPSGEEALGLTDMYQYDLIFMDHMMPVMDGIECLHRMREQQGGRNLDTPVVALTANDGSTSRSLYKSEGFDGYLVKPIDTNELGNIMLSLLPQSKLIIQDLGADDIEEKISRQAVVQKIPILITTESVSDIPDDIIREKNIPVIPCSVHTDKGTFLDGIEIDAKGLGGYMEKNHAVVSSDPPSVLDYEAFFSRNLKIADHIIHITMSKAVGEGGQRALEAAESFDNVDVFDSAALSAGLGLMVLIARKMADGGASPEEVLKALERLSGSIRCSFVVDDPEYLSRAGRLNATIGRVCSMVLMKPELRMKRGRLVVGRIRFGRRHTVWRKYIRASLETMGKIDDEILFVTHVGLGSDDQKWIKDEIKQVYRFKRVYFLQASPAIAANAGPGAFGLFFKMKY
ncbi:MAG: DegV family EDD domain-containing protein [Lachnospiraceae bacterium]|nr:DegV family EDD domain-containing protein [Lachnospiraceae bacterium]